VTREQIERMQNLEDNQATLVDLLRAFTAIRDRETEDLQQLDGAAEREPIIDRITRLNGCLFHILAALQSLDDEEPSDEHRPT